MKKHLAQNVLRSNLPKPGLALLETAISRSVPIVTKKKIMSWPNDLPREIVARASAYIKDLVRFGLTQETLMETTARQTFRSFLD